MGSGEGIKIEFYVQITMQKFSEATIGHEENGKIAKKLVQLFSTLCFLVKTHNYECNGHNQQKENAKSGF